MSLQGPSKLSPYLQQATASRTRVALDSRMHVRVRKAHKSLAVAGRMKTRSQDIELLQELVHKEVEVIM